MGAMLAQYTVDWLGLTDVTSNASLGEAAGAWASARGAAISAVPKTIGTNRKTKVGSMVLVWIDAGSADLDGWNA